MLLDRVVEADALERLLAGVRAGLSGVLVVRGEAGVGKTALLESAVESAADMQVARVLGVESEMELAFAALHQLLVPFLGGLEGLPVPQRDALGSAFGLVSGLAADRFLVGLAALTLVTDAAVEQPVLCVVDDAQWLDQASIDVLGFVARRLFADRVGMLFAVRDGEERAVVFEGLSELRLGGLPEDAAGELLSASVGGALDQGLARRIVAETVGNPLALIELGSELTADDLSGTAALGEPLRLGARLEELFLSRGRALPAETQRLLLVAAADPSGEAALLWRAAERLGIDRDAAEIPELERLLTFAPTVRFRHPLMRSAIYYGSSSAARRRAHEALAAVSDPELDPDRRAWHAAQAATGPDERVAVELERSADRARARGGWASGAAFLTRAAELTPDHARAAQRTLDAAYAKLIAGEVGSARALLEQAAPQLREPLGRGEARRLEGRIRLALGQPSEAPAILLEAARAFEPLDVRLTRDTLLEAFEAAYLAGKYARDAGMSAVLGAVRAAPGVEESAATAGDHLLDGFAALHDIGHEAGAPLLRQAVTALVEDELAEGGLRLLNASAWAAVELLDDTAWHAVAMHWVREARSRGALTGLPVALTSLAYYEAFSGRFAAAEAALAEGREIAAATGPRRLSNWASAAELTALAWRGREADARAVAHQLGRDFAELGQGLGIPVVKLELVVLELGLGKYAAALGHAFAVYQDDAMGTGTRSMPDVVEAAVRCGEVQTAASALEKFSPRALASGSDWALGMLLRSRALLSPEGRAEDLYREAIEHLSRCQIAPQLARAHLLYGEWLRRQRRRRDARAALRIALEMFESIGAEAFAERTRVELLATGEHARARTVETRDALTQQEAQIARLAGEGASNQEIAAQLFLSAATVAYHLRKVFRKLGITTRTRLTYALDEQHGGADAVRLTR